MRWATAPATCGQAAEVPLNFRVAVSESAQADKIFSPGANRSTHLPKLLLFHLASKEVVAATAIVFSATAGHCLQASSPRLPAATTSVLLAFASICKAVCNESGFCR